MTINKRFIIPIFDRRTVLKLGTAAVGAALLDACGDSLHLPPLEEDGGLGLDGGGPVVSDNEIRPISTANEFYVQHWQATPGVSDANWTLDISNPGAAAQIIDFDFLEGLPAREKEHTLQCIGSSPGFRLIGNAVWSGLPLREVFEELAITPSPDAVELKWTCWDQYHVSVPIADLETMWLVWGMNDEPLTPDHGRPARLLTPGRYGTKNPKWPSKLELVTQPWQGLWEAQGWSNDATYRLNTFIIQPLSMAQLGQDSVRFLGTAFAGSDPIERVEISTDGGSSWNNAEITYGPGADIWTLWRFDWQPPLPGRYSIQARATAVSGQTSDPAPNGTDQLGGFDGSMAIEVDVI